MDILKQTRKRENIQLLKAREASYHQARKLNTLVILLSIVPIIFSILSNITGFKLTKFIHLDRLINEKMAGVILSFSVFLFTLFITEKIKRLKEFSNDVRELYDCKVFDLPINKYQTRIRSGQDVERFAKKEKDFELYPVWYGETFSSSHYINVAVCQVDNISYAAFLYKKLNRLLLVVISIVTILLIGLVISYHHFEKAFFDVLIPSFTIYSLIFKVTYKSSYIQRDYQPLLQQIIEDASVSNIDKIYLRMVQDKILHTRSNDIITPKYIRLKLLGENNEYKDFMKDFKEIVCGNDLNRPEKIPLYNLNYEDTNTIDELQALLLKMLKEVDRVCNENNLPYILDGGTLLGSIREQGFIPWDDDIDIGIKYEDQERFYSILSEKLPEGYSLQCFQDDSFYSPVLPKFRIRMDQTEVIEKLDNASCHFQHKGIFIDVYTFDYALKFLWVDKLFRLMIMLPMYKVLTKLDMMGKGRLRLIFLKKSYLRLETIYCKLPKNKDWISYSPAYLYKPLHPGPYYRSEKVFNGSNLLPFQDLFFQGPADPCHVLQTCYGEDYLIPNKTYTTVLQHLKAVNLNH